MRKKAKYIITDPEPGTTRLKRVFAWMPTKVDDEIVWLEHFEILQAFLIFEYKIIIDKAIKQVSVGQWKDISKRVAGN